MELSLVYSGQGTTVAVPSGAAVDRVDVNGTSVPFVDNGNDTVTLASAPALRAVIRIRYNDPTDAQPVTAALKQRAHAATNDAALAKALDEVGDYGVIRLPAGRFRLSAGVVINRAVRFVGTAPGTVIRFTPTTPNETLFTWTGVNVPEALLNEEGQLSGPGVERVYFNSDRSIDANCLKFVKCDNVVLQNVFIQGFRGSSIVMQRSREWSFHDVVTRYNGRLDYANPNNDSPCVLFASSEASGDTTNYTKNTNLKIIYPFGDALRVEDCPDMDFANVMIHQLPLANTQAELNIVRQFPRYLGAPAAAGFGAAGVPLNEFAAAHLSPGAPAASVAGRGWRTQMLRTIGIYVNNSDVRLTGGELVGGLTNYGVWNDAGGRLDMSNFNVVSQSAARQGSTTQYSSTFTFASSLLTVTAPCPDTGTPVQVTNSGGTLPTGITRKVTYYLIKVSDTTCRLASTRKNAFAGTNITISGGSGTQTVTALSGFNVLTTGGSTTCLGHYGGVRMNDGFQAMFHDLTSQVFGTPLVGTTYSNGTVAPHNPAMQLLFVLRDVDMTLTTDQAFTKVFGGSRYVVTDVIAKGLGGTAGAGTAGGIYTGAGKTGSTLVAAAQSWTGLSTINKIQKATLDTFANTDAIVATPILSLTTGSGSTCRADFYIYGIPID